METVNTIIEFVNKGVPPAPAPNPVQTGDVVGILIAVILAFAFVAMLVYSVSLRRQAAEKAPLSSIVRFKKPLAFSFVIAFAAVAVLTATLSGLVPRLFAQEDNAIVKSDDKIHAIVNEETGDVQIDPSSISKIKDAVKLTSLSLDYCEGVQITDDCTWTVEISGEEIYNDKIGQTVECDQSIDDEEVKYSVARLSKETAIALIGKPVVKVSFGVEKAIKFYEVKFAPSEEGGFVDAEGNPVTSITVQEGTKIEQGIDKSVEGHYKGTLAIKEPGKDPVTIYAVGGQGEPPTKQFDHFEGVPTEITSPDIVIDAKYRAAKFKFNFNTENGKVFDEKGNQATWAYADYGTPIITDKDESNPGHTVGIIKITEDGQQKTYRVVGNEPDYQFKEFIDMPAFVTGDIDIKIDWATAQYQVSFKGQNGAAYDSKGQKIEGFVLVDQGATIDYTIDDTNPGKQFAKVEISKDGKVLHTISVKGDETNHFQFDKFITSLPLTINGTNQEINFTCKKEQAKIDFSGSNGKLYDKDGNQVTVVYADWDSAIITDSYIDDDGQKVGTIKFIKDGEEFSYYAKGNDDYQFKEFQNVPPSVQTESISIVMVYKNATYPVSFKFMEGHAAHGKYYDADHQECLGTTVDVNSKIYLSKDQSVPGVAKGIIQIKYNDAVVQEFTVEGIDTWQFDTFAEISSSPITVDSKTDITASFATTQYYVTFEAQKDSSGNVMGKFYDVHDAEIPTTGILLDYNSSITYQIDDSNPGNKVGKIIFNKDVAGKEVIVVVKGIDDYQFDSWDASAKPDHVIPDAQGKINIKAKFAKEQFKVTFSAEENGQFDYDPTGIVTDDSIWLDKNTSISYSEKGPEGTAVQTITFTNPSTSDVILKATAKATEEAYQLNTLTSDKATDPTSLTENITYTATFKDSEFQITLNADDGQGAFFQSDKTTPASTMFYVKYNTEVAYDAEDGGDGNQIGKLSFTEPGQSPSVFYAIGKTSFQFEDFSAVPDFSDDPKKVKEAHTITASFTTAAWTVTFSPSSYGAVYLNNPPAAGEEPVATVPVNDGDTLTIEENVGTEGQKVGHITIKNNSDTINSVTTDYYAIGNQDAMTPTSHLRYQFKEFDKSGTITIEDNITITTTYEDAQYQLSFTNDTNGDFYNSLPDDEVLSSVESIYVNYGTTIEAVECSASTTGHAIGQINVQEPGKDAVSYYAIGNKEDSYYKYQFNNFEDFSSPIYAATELKANFKLAQYKVSLTADSNGLFYTDQTKAHSITEIWVDYATQINKDTAGETGQMQGVVIFNKNLESQQSIYAIGNTFYQFNQFDIFPDDGSYIVEDTDVSATFKTEQYKITFSINPAEKGAIHKGSAESAETVTQIYVDRGTTVAQSTEGDFGQYVGKLEFSTLTDDYYAAGITNYQFASFDNVPTGEIQESPADPIVANFITEQHKVEFIDVLDEGSHIGKFNTQPDGSGTDVTVGYYDHGTTVTYTKLSTETYQGKDVGKITFDDVTSTTTSPNPVYAIGIDSTKRFDDWTSQPTPINADDQIKASFKTSQFEITFQVASGSGAYYKNSEGTGDSVTSLFFDAGTEINCTKGGTEGQEYGIIQFGPTGSLIDTVYAIGSSGNQFVNFDSGPTSLDSDITIKATFSSASFKIEFSVAEGGGSGKFSSTLDGAGTSTYEIRVNAGTTVTKVETITPEGNDIHHLIFKDGATENNVYIKGDGGYQFNSITPSFAVSDEISENKSVEASFKTGKYKISFPEPTAGNGKGSVNTYDSESDTFTPIDHVYISSGVGLTAWTETINNQTAGTLSYRDDEVDYTLYAIGADDDSGRAQYQFDSFISYPSSIIANADVTVKYTAAKYKLTLTNADNACFYTDSECTTVVSSDIIVSYGTQLAAGTPIQDGANDIGVLTVTDSEPEEGDLTTYYAKSKTADKQFSGFSTIDTPVYQNTTVSANTDSTAQYIVTFAVDPASSGWFDTSISGESLATPKTSVKVDYGTALDTATVDGVVDGVDYQGHARGKVSFGTGSTDDYYARGNASYQFDEFSFSDSSGPITPPPTNITKAITITASFKTEQLKISLLSNPTGAGKFYDNDTGTGTALDYIMVDWQSSITQDTPVGSEGSAIGKINVTKDTASTSYYAKANEASSQWESFTGLPLNNLTENKTITANFSSSSFAVTFKEQKADADPAKGHFTEDVTDTDTSKIITSSLSFAYGTKVEFEVVYVGASYNGRTYGHFTFKDNEGAVVKDVYAFGDKESDTYKYQFDDLKTTLPAEGIVSNLDINSTFKAAQYKVTFTAGDNGKFVDSNSSEITDPMWFDYNSVISYSTQSLDSKTAGNVTIGETIVKAVGNTGYEFDAFIPDAVTDISPLTSDIEIKASFKIQGFNLTLANDGNGAFYESQDGSGSAVSIVPVDYNTTIAKGTTINPDSGRAIGVITVTPQGGTVKSYYAVGNKVSSVFSHQFDSFTGLDSDITVEGNCQVTASFKAAQYKVTFIAEENGKFLDSTPSEITEPKWFDYGTAVSVSDGGSTGVATKVVTIGSFTATATGDTNTVTGKQEHQVNTLTCNAGAISSMTQDVTITATFKKAQYKLTLGGTNGAFYTDESRTAISGDIYVDYGTEISQDNTYTTKTSSGQAIGKVDVSQPEMTAVSYYALGDLDGTSPDVYEKYQFDTSTAMVISSSPVYEATSVTATFKYATYTLTFDNDHNGAVYNTESVTFGADGIPSVSPTASITVSATTTVSWTSSSSTDVKTRKGVITVTEPGDADATYYYAIGNPGYIFQQFDKSNSFAITSNITMTSSFIYGEYSITISIDSEASHGAVYYHNEEVPQESNKVTEPITVTGTTILSSYADSTYSDRQVIKLSIPNSTGGTTEQFYYAIGDPGYVFDEITNPTTLPYNIDADLTLEINFKYGTYTLDMTGATSGDVYTDTSCTTPVTELTVNGQTKITHQPYSSDTTIEQITVEQPGQTAVDYYAKGNTGYVFDDFATPHACFTEITVTDDVTLTPTFVQIFEISFNVNNTSWGNVFKDNVAEHLSTDYIVDKVVVEIGCSITAITDSGTPRLIFDNDKVVSGPSTVYARPTNAAQCAFDSFGAFTSPVTASETIAVNFKLLTTNITFASNPSTLGDTVYDSTKTNVKTSITIPANSMLTYEADSSNTNMEKLTFTPPTGFGDPTVLYTKVDHYKFSSLTDAGGTEIPKVTPIETTGTFPITVNYEQTDIKITFSSTPEAADGGVYESSSSTTPLTEAWVPKNYYACQSYDSDNSNYGNLYFCKNSSGTSSDDIKFWVKANTENYVFTDLLMNGTSLPWSYSSSRVQITADSSIEAQFIQVRKVTFIVNPTEGGSLLDDDVGSGSPIANPLYVHDGSTVRFAGLDNRLIGFTATGFERRVYAIASDGYDFVKYTYQNGTDVSDFDTITADTTITANFMAPVTGPSITLTTDGNGHFYKGATQSGSIIDGQSYSYPLATYPDGVYIETQMGVLTVKYPGPTYDSDGKETDPGTVIDQFCVVPNSVSSGEKPWILENYIISGGTYTSLPIVSLQNDANVEATFSKEPEVDFGDEIPCEILNSDKASNPIGDCRVNPFSKVTFTDQYYLNFYVTGFEEWNNLEPKSRSYLTDGSQKTDPTGWPIKYGPGDYKREGHDGVVISYKLNTTIGNDNTTTIYESLFGNWFLYGFDNHYGVLLVCGNGGSSSTSGEVYKCVKITLSETDETGYFDKTETNSLYNSNSGSAIPAGNNSAIADELQPGNPDVIDGDAIEESSPFDVIINFICCLFGIKQN